MARGEDGNGFLSNNCQVSSHPSLQLKNNTQIYEEVLILRKVDMVLDFYLNIKDIEYTIISDQVTTTDFENCIIFSHPFTYADINQEQLRGHNVALDMIIFVNGNKSFCLDSGLIFSLRSCLSTLQNMTQKFHLTMPRVDYGLRSKSQFYFSQEVDIFVLTYNTIKSQFLFTPIKNKIACKTETFSLLHQMNKESQYLIEQLIKNFHALFKHLNLNVQVQKCTHVISDAQFYKNWRHFQHSENLYSIFCFNYCFPTFIYSAKASNDKLEQCHYRYLAYLNLIEGKEPRIRRDLTDVFLGSSKLNSLQQNQMKLRSNLNVLNRNTKYFYHTERKLGLELKSIELNEKNLRENIIANRLNIHTVYNSLSFTQYLGFLASRKTQVLNQKLHQKASLHRILFEGNYIIDTIYSKFTENNCHRNLNSYICQISTPDFIQNNKTFYMIYSAHEYELVNRFKFKCLDVGGEISILHDKIFSKNDTHYLDQNNQPIPHQCLLSNACKDYFTKNMFNFDKKYCSYIFNQFIYINCATKISFITSTKQTLVIGQSPVRVRQEQFPLCYQNSNECYSPQLKFMSDIPVLSDLQLDMLSDKYFNDNGIHDRETKLSKIHTVTPHPIIDSQSAYIKYTHYSVTGIIILILIILLLLICCWHRTCMASSIINKLGVLLAKANYTRTSTTPEPTVSFQNNEVTLTPPGGQLPRNKSQTLPIPGATFTHPGFIVTPGSPAPPQPPANTPHGLFSISPDPPLSTHPGHMIWSQNAFRGFTKDNTPSLPKPQFGLGSGHEVTPLKNNQSLFSSSKQSSTKTTRGEKSKVKILDTKTHSDSQGKVEASVKDSGTGNGTHARPEDPPLAPRQFGEGFNGISIPPQDSEAEGTFLEDENDPSLGS